MNRDEKNLSDYIDRLNAEKKPKEHEGSANSQELERLFETVRQVRSLKEPALPNQDYPKKLARSVAGRLASKGPAKNTKRVWFIGVAAAAAVIFTVVILNFILPLNKTNIVYAMEKAFQGIKAYHGFLEIVVTNGEGKASTQARLEVWADKEGRYYVKELEGVQEGLITVNNGQRKWQLQPAQKQAYIFPAFPDPYRFSFELGKEVEDVKNALKSNVIGEDTVAGRSAYILEVSPQGGVPYRLWIDKETRLPLQKQSGMQNELQYRITYTEVDFGNDIPGQFITYNLPAGFKETDTKPEQIVTNLGEAGGIAGFTPKAPESVPAEYSNDSIAVQPAAKIVKLNFVTQDKAKRVVILESKSVGEFKPASTAVLGKVNNSVAEIQSPVQDDTGIFGSGTYGGVTDISSIRWQQDGFEYAVLGNTSLEELVLFVKGMANGTVEIPAPDAQSPDKPKVTVPVDLEVEENEQKSVDGGHSPWRLDPVFVAQVFVSLKISPEGIQGDYPIKTEELKVTKNNGTDVIIEVSGDKTPVRKVYLKRLVRQDATGIWTVVGYDPVK